MPAGRGSDRSSQESGQVVDRGRGGRHGLRGSRHGLRGGERQAVCKLGAPHRQFPRGHVRREVCGGASYSSQRRRANSSGDKPGMLRP